MLSNNQLFTLLKKSAIVHDLYDKGMHKLARMNGGEYILNENTQRLVTIKAFNTVLGTETVDVSYAECVAFFDIVQRK